MTKHRIYTTSFASVYPLYVAKAERKGRTRAEVDQVISWLTGYGQKELETQLENKTDFETFFAKAPKLNPSRALIKGVICGVRVEDIKEPTMQEIRYLDKLIDELARGKAIQDPAEIIPGRRPHAAGGPMNDFSIDRIMSRSCPAQTARQAQTKTECVLSARARVCCPSL
ncbi:DUF2200 domain-containing protein [Bradyrhizobium diazoefficiens]|nr:DUF2200 domain-containing protein [Bradyrhizobium diazoefficiens]